MTKSVTKRSIILVVFFALIISFINPVIKTTRAEEYNNSSIVEKELEGIINKYGKDNIVFENGIILNQDEEIDLEQLDDSSEISWSTNNNSILDISNNKILKATNGGTTFLIGQAGSKYYVREVYVKGEMRTYVSFGGVEAKAAQKYRYVVYIDPGHGGSDPGASGVKSKEKDLVLQMGLQLRTKLESKGIIVEMSRDTDKYVSLQDRSSGANALNPDVFISIHANAYNKNIRGMETFYYKGIDKPFADIVHRDMIGYTGISNESTLNRKVKKENFHVTRETSMPATLVETGFIDNVQDEQLLMNPSYQDKITNGLTNAINEYLVNNITLNSIPNERVFGLNRYETSYNIFKKWWGSSDNVVLASGLDYPDALCAAPLAKKYNAPILLAENSKLSSQPKLKAVLQEKKVKTVYITGGVGVIPQSLENEIKAMGITTVRLGGKDRYETSAIIAKAVAPQSNEVAIAYGLDFPDGLSMSSIAAKKGIPILLTEKDNLPTKVKEYMNVAKVNKSYIIGMQGVISDGVMKQCPGAERLGGKNRYETNTAIFNRFKNEINLDNVYVASALDFADALSISPVAAKEGGFVILSNTNSVEEQVKNLVYKNRDKIKKTYILGSDKVISNRVIYGIGL